MTMRKAPRRRGGGGAMSEAQKAVDDRVRAAVDAGVNPKHADLVAASEGAFGYVKYRTDFGRPGAKGVFVKAEKARQAVLEAERAKRPKINNILLVAREWHRRSYGGMYHTVEIFVNGEHVVKLPMAGGSGTGSMPEQRAVEWLVANGYLGELQAPEERHGGRKMLWQVAQDEGFKLNKQNVPVQREKDL
jgi:hypothetical protein